MAERLKFTSMGISVEGEKHILEDLVRTIREAEGEGIEAGNPVSDLIYSIEVGLQLNGMGRDVEEEEEVPAHRGRLDRLKAYKENEAALKQAEEQKKMNEAESLVGKIKALKPRIDELLAVGNACLESGISLDAYRRSFSRSSDSYEHGTFVTNGISHHVGFVRDWGVSDKGHHQFTMLGINNGGACGPYDFRTDGEKVYFVHENNKSDFKGPDYKIADLTAFIKRFDEFESAFYSYVDKVLEKQEHEVEKKLGSVGDMIADATKRAGTTASNEKVRGIEFDC